MHVTYRGVNDAFRGLVRTFQGGDGVVESTSRNGPVLKVVGPVTVTFERPRERVLFSRARDANPFLHLYEILWMLAGRNDVAPLTYYAGNFASYSDDDRTLNGAYGRRWRHSDGGVIPGQPVSMGNPSHYDVDQLKIIVDHLRQKPDSRRAVLQMWNVEDDLLKVGDGSPEFSKDVCCNLSVCFSIHDTSNGLRYTQADFVPEEKRGQPIGPRVLDMTVFNRSNDLVWGLLGSDVVHFSVLQEYVAACLSVEVGTYHHVTNDLHVYTKSNSGFYPERWLTDETPNYYELGDDDPSKSLTTVDLVDDPETFDRELSILVEYHSSQRTIPCQERLTEPFLKWVVDPMFFAFALHKNKAYSKALEKIDEVRSDDWRVAGRNWLLRRKVNHEKKSI